MFKLFTCILLLAVLENCLARSQLAPIHRVVPSHAGITKTSLATQTITNGHHSKITDPPSSGAGVVSSSVNLAKSIVGLGALALPSGLGYVSDERSAVVPAVFVCALFGALASHSFCIVGEVCAETGANSYLEAYRATVSNSSAIVVPIVTTVTCLLNLLTCSNMIGEFLSPYTLQRYNI